MMFASNKSQPSALRRIVFRTDMLILLMIIAGFALNIVAPLWLKPPLFEYTIWLYLAAFFAWVPLYLIYARRQRRHWFFVAFILLGMCLATFLCMVFVPRSAFALTYFDTIRCEQVDTVEGRQLFACTRESFEGEGSRTLVLESVEWLPVMWLLEDNRSETR